MEPKKKIIIIGSLLPPSGGVSIHIWRIWQLLKNEYIIDFIDEARSRKPEYFNLRSLDLITYFKKLAASDIVFIHSVTRIQRYFHILASRVLGKKVVFTVHAYLKKESLPIRKMDQLIFGLSDKIILVNSNIHTRIQLPKNKTEVQNAFLPPVMEEESPLPSHITEMISKARREGMPVICSNAWRPERFNNEDLYGIDLCLEAARNLKEKKIPFLFIFNVSTIEGCEEIYSRDQETLRKYQLEDHFKLLNERMSFVKLIEKSDVVIRATNTDGDSLSIRESLYLGKSIIASDVIQRPDGTRLFRNRDVADLEQKITKSLNDVKAGIVDPHKNGFDYSGYYYRLFGKI